MAGIYISYPFCAQKCTFCNFASGVHGAAVGVRYTEALFEEIRNTSLPFTPDTLYLGGGTPSAMEPEALTKLLALLPFPFREATLEAAPGTITPEKAWHWRASGINRISLGVQSFDTAELRRTGRSHTAQTVEQEVRLLRREGIENFNIDLIAGLPGQTAASWETSLRWIEALEPPHVSVYMFEIDEDSHLGAEVLLNGKRYGAPDLPSEELTAELYETAADRLAGLGIPRYEISNFARPGSESLHNLKYWQLAPYVGFGAGAHSFDGRLRSQNPEELEDYLGAKSLRQSEPACDSERFWVGLRLMQGIIPSGEEWHLHKGRIERLIGGGLLERSGEFLRLTKRGVMLSNNVFEEFLPT